MSKEGCISMGYEEQENRINNIMAHYNIITWYKDETVGFSWKIEEGHEGSGTVPYERYGSLGAEWLLNAITDCENWNAYPDTVTGFAQYCVDHGCPVTERMFWKMNEGQHEKMYRETLEGAASWGVCTQSPHWPPCHLWRSAL